MSAMWQDPNDVSPVDLPLPSLDAMMRRADKQTQIVIDALAELGDTLDQLLNEYTLPAGTRGPLHAAAMALPSLGDTHNAVANATDAYRRAA